MKLQFKSGDVAKILNVPVMTLRDWMQRGFIKPSVPSKTKGSAALFDLFDLYAIRCFQTFLALGFSRENAADHSRYLRRATPFLRAPEVRVGIKELRVFINFFLYRLDENGQATMSMRVTTSDGGPSAVGLRSGPVGGMLCPPSHYAPDTTRKKDLSSDQSELDELPEEPGVLKAMYSICLSDIIKEVDEGLVKLGYIKEDNEMK